MSHTAQMAADEIDRLRKAVEDWHDIAGRAERERDEAVSELTYRISLMHEQRRALDDYRALWHEACEEAQSCRHERDECVTQLTARLHQMHEQRRAIDALELHRIPELEQENERLKRLIKMQDEFINRKSGVAADRAQEIETLRNALDMREGE